MEACARVEHMRAPKRWVAADEWCVEIGADVLDAIIRMADEAHPLETGAALYGSYSADQRLARVEGLAPAPQDSKRGRFHFHRGVLGLAGFFRRLFRQTKGEAFYVGEFHSHPGGASSPSLQDDAAQFGIASDPDCHCQSPLLVIVGGRPEVRTIGVFVHTRDGERFVFTGIQ